MKKRYAFAVGAVVGLILFGAGREVWSYVATRGVGAALSNAIWWLGTFQWLVTYQTLIAGGIALWGAWWAARAVHRQIQQTQQIEDGRRIDKRAAIRVMLPFALSSISDYAIECTQELKLLIEQVDAGILPEAAKVGQFPELPLASLTAIAELVALSSNEERVFLSRLLGTIQIQRSRLQSIVSRHAREGHMVLDANLKRYIVDSAEIYAQSAALYRYARSIDDGLPQRITHSQIAAALMNMSIFDDLYDELVERYGLAGEEIWVPPFAAS